RVRRGSRARHREGVGPVHGGVPDRLRAQRDPAAPGAGLQDGEQRPLGVPPAADVAELRSRHPFVSALLVLAGASLFGTVGTAQAIGPEVPSSSLAAARMLLTA